MFEHATVTPEFVHTAKHRATLRQHLPARPATVFACLEDGDAWTVWLGLNSVRWTSELGVGATRTIRNGPLVIDEEFYLWEQDEAVAFRFARSMLPLRTVAEEYRIQDNGDGTCEIVWSFAADARVGLLAAAFIRSLTRLGRRSLPNLARYLAEVPAG